MKRSIVFLMSLSFVVASCGISAQYYQQEFQDGIYSRSTPVVSNTPLYTEDDFVAMAAKNIADKEKEKEKQMSVDSLFLKYSNGGRGSWNQVSENVNVSISLFPVGLAAASWAGSWWWNRWYWDCTWNPWWDPFWDPFWDPWWGPRWYNPGWYHPGWGPYHPGWGPHHPGGYIHHRDVVWGHRGIHSGAGNNHIRVAGSPGGGAAGVNRRPGTYRSGGVSTSRPSSGYTRGGGYTRSSGGSYTRVPSGTYSRSQGGMSRSSGYSGSRNSSYSGSTRSGYSGSTRSGSSSRSYTPGRSSSSST